MTVTYLRLELLRTYRNIRYLLFTLGIPVILFLVIGGAFDNQRVLGVSGQTWYMINMATFGALGAVLGVGARIAVERDAGWNRQLRLTPLPPEGYVVGKVIVGMLLALPSLLLVCATGFLTGEVHLAALQWVEVIGLGWVATAPDVGRGRRPWLPGPGRYGAGRQRRRCDADVDVRRRLVPGRRQLAAVAAVRGPRATDVLDHADRPRAPLTHDWPVVSGWLVLAAWTFVGIRIAARRYLADDLRAA